jgi:glutamate-1-semialdehyde 2,1-aminomutase
VCFARGTFNSHPYVLGAMQAFLDRLDEADAAASYASLDATWGDRAEALNDALAARDLPLRVVALASVWTVCHEAESRYNWLLQFYLRAHGLALSWVGTGRLIFSHAMTPAEFEEVCRRFVAAAEAMRADGWWTGGAPGQARRQMLRELASAWVGSIISPRRI